MNKRIEKIAIIDTHIWIWLANDAPQIQSPRFLKKIQDFESHKGLRISVISIWEIGLLHKKGRIELPFSIQQWVKKALDIPGITVAELTPDMALESNLLPGEFHGDPADRMILATAKSLGATLVTADQRMLEYSKKHHLKTISPKE